MTTAHAAAFLPELSEDRATGSTKEIYEQIKRLCGVPMVALIYRHLATLPGALEWAWSAIGPAMASGRLQEAAWRVARETRPEPMAAFLRPALEALGIDDQGLREIRAVVEAYNRANPVNLLAVRCLARLIEGANSKDTLAWAAQPAEWTPPPPLGPLIPMVDLAAMPEPVAQLLFAVASRGAQADIRVVPSLYRHFGNRPGFLALLVTLLLPRFEDGSISRSVRAIRASMDAPASELARGMIAPPAPDRGIGAALERFGRGIPEMITVGRLLEGALPAAERGTVT